MGYKIGDKFIIEIDRTYASKKNEVSRYGIKGFSTLIFDYEGLKRIERFNRYEDVEKLKMDEWERARLEGYNDGLKHGEELLNEARSDDSKYWLGVDVGTKKAWDAARTIFVEFSDKDMRTVFGEDADDNAMLFAHNTIEDVFNKLDKYEEKMEKERGSIKLGDEVEAWDTNKWVRFIAWSVYYDTVSGIGLDGGMYEYPLSSCRKTGRRFDVEAADQLMIG